MIDPKKQMRKVRRMAKTLKDGPAILNRLCEDDARQLLVEGVEEEVPPVTKISGLLGDDFDEETLVQMPVRQFVGVAVKAILAEDGYEPMETGVRVDDPIFRSGATYQKVEVEEVDDGEILVSMISNLDKDKLQRLKSLVDEALENA